MPLITRKQFAELCGDDILKINKWIQRGKILTVPDNKKLINTENPINAAFASERKVFNVAKGMGVITPKAAEKPVKAPKKTAEIPVIEPEKKRGRPKKEVISSVNLHEKVKTEPKSPKKQPIFLPKPAEIRQKERQLADQNVQAKLRMDQDYLKKALDIENAELNKQLTMLRLNKSAGNLLPVDLVKGVLKRHGDTFFKTFEKSIERFVSIICGSDQETYVKHLANVKDILSKTIADAGKLADEEILILVNDYSETLARGQKKI